MIINGTGTGKEPKSPTKSCSDSVLIISQKTGHENLKTKSGNKIGDSLTSPNGVRQTDTHNHISKSENGGSDSRHSLESVDKANGGSAISQEFFSAESDSTEQEDVFLDPVEARIPTFFSVLNPR